MPDLSEMNLSRSADEGAVMTLYHPVNGEPIIDDTTGQPWTITLAGQDSERFRKATQANTNRRLSMRRGRPGQITAQELDNEALELLVACTLSWSGITLELQPLAFEPNNVRKVYRDFPWVREQVDAFIGDRANFSTPSRPSYSSTSRQKQPE